MQEILRNSFAFVKKIVFIKEIRTVRNAVIKKKTMCLLEKYKQ